MRHRFLLNWLENVWSQADQVFDRFVIFCPIGFSFQSWDQIWFYDFISRLTKNLSESRTFGWNWNCPTKECGGKSSSLLCCHSVRDILSSIPPAKIDHRCDFPYCDWQMSCVVHPFLEGFKCFFFINLVFVMGQKHNMDIVLNAFNELPKKRLTKKPIKPPVYWHQTEW